MEQKRFNVATDDEIIKSNEKWFKFFVHFPMVLTIVYSVIVFFAGLILACVVPDGTLFLLLWLGLIGSPLVYCITKLALSYQILHIYYLKKFTRGSVVIDNASNNENNVDEDELPQI